MPSNDRAEESEHLRISVGAPRAREIQHSPLELRVWRQLLEPDRSVVWPAKVYFRAEDTDRITPLTYGTQASELAHRLQFG